MRHSAVTVAGVRSPVAEVGPAESGEAVVFVHGNPGSIDDWADLMARLPEHVRAVALDMPGYGGADRPGDFDYTATGYAAHLGAVLDQLGVRQAHLVLHDFGGPWGLAWAATHRGAARSVVLVDTGVLLGYRWHRMARIWRTPVLGELSFRAMSERTLRRGLDSRLARPLPDDAIRRALAAYRDPGTQRAVLRLYRATPDPGKGGAQLLRDLLRPLDLPALVLWGAHDPFLPVAQAEVQLETFPRARVVVLPDSGHWPLLDDPDGAASAIVPFLTVQYAGG